MAFATLIEGLMETFAHTAQFVTTVLTAASMVYCLLVLVAAIHFRLYARRVLPAVKDGKALSISILKPVKGLDAGMYEAFRSHCLQDYAGEYELLFGASSLDDPAVAAVEQLKAEFPDLAIQLVLCPEQLGTNGKVSNLIQMMPQARYEIVLINDSDIRVSPRYLQRVAEQFAVTGKKQVGLVTALYRGRTVRSAEGRLTLGSILEGLGISTDFMGGVLCSRMVENGVHFGLGSTLAARREALTAIGGVKALVDQLADDYEMGCRIEKAGYAIRLATEVVETSVPPYSMRGFWSHQIRWARTVRDSRKWGYLGLMFTYLLPLAFANVIASGASLWSMGLLGLAFFLRVATAMQVGTGVLSDHQVLRDLWLLPIRDCVGCAVWIWSFAGNTIEWRGERFVLKNGELFKA